jgi:hypothetical protein
MNSPLLVASTVSSTPMTNKLFAHSHPRCTKGAGMTNPSARNQVFERPCDHRGLGSSAELRSGIRHAIMCLLICFEQGWNCSNVAITGPGTYVHSLLVRSLPMRFAGHANRCHVFCERASSIQTCSGRLGLTAVRTQGIG